MDMIPASRCKVALDDGDIETGAVIRHQDGIPINFLDGFPQIPAKHKGFGFASVIGTDDRDGIVPGQASGLNIQVQGPVLKIAEGPPFMIGWQALVKKRPYRIAIGLEGLSQMLTRPLHPRDVPGQLRAGDQIILPGPDTGIPEAPLPNQPDAGYMNE